MSALTISWVGPPALSIRPLIRVMTYEVLPTGSGMVRSMRSAVFLKWSFRPMGLPSTNCSRVTASPSRHTCTRSFPAEPKTSHAYLGLAPACKYAPTPTRTARAASGRSHVFFMFMTRLLRGEVQASLFDSIIISNANCIRSQAGKPDLLGEGGLLQLRTHSHR